MKKATLLLAVLALLNIALVSAKAAPRSLCTIQKPHCCDVFPWGRCPR